MGSLADRQWVYDNSSKSNSVFEFLKKGFEKITGTETVVETVAENYESKITKFYEELIKVSDSLGLGKDISIDIVYDGSYPERVFTINVPFRMNRKEKYDYLDQIVNDMVVFSKENNIFDFYKDAYILIK